MTLRSSGLAAFSGLAVLALAAPAPAQPPTTSPGGAGIEMDKDHPLCADKRGKDYGAPGPLDPAKGRVVIFRASALFGAPLSFRVREGEIEYCTLGNGTYFMLDMAPGVHRFDAHTVGKDALPMEVNPGETKYIQVKMALGGVTYVPNLIPSDQADFDKVKAKLNHSRF